MGLQSLEYQDGRVLSTLYPEYPRWLPAEIEAAFAACDWAVLHDPTNTNSASVADKARRLVQKGIEHDERLHEGRHESCGGKVDVVVVDSAGARLM